MCSSLPRFAKDIDHDPQREIQEGFDIHEKMQQKEKEKPTNITSF